ncbi:MAG TPA: prepilin-type N-terminal cleavage/methylation domain-containing protein [Usitatibacter sp.]|nr:prepilin-type N-terminal cleavage/methylation domain-containing protein [Usitatibacter sp.]
MRPRGASPGFTLIELLVVMAIISTLLALAIPRYFHSEDRARETALRHDLTVMREAIDRHYGDTGKYPASLQELVAKKYLRRVPADPITGSVETWVVVPPADRDRGGVFDIASGAPGNGRDGTPYAQW